MDRSLSDGWGEIRATYVVLYKKRDAEMVRHKVKVVELIKTKNDSLYTTNYSIGGGGPLGLPMTACRTWVLLHTI